MTRPMPGSPRSVRVVPALASRQPGDEAVIVDPAAVAVVQLGPGRVVVRADGRDAWAIIGVDRAASPTEPFLR